MPTTRPCPHCGKVMLEVDHLTHECYGKTIQKPPEKSKGLGDTVAKVTKKFGISPCGGCKKRQKKLNEMFPYKDQDDSNS